jgi:hypothetical protein
MGIKTNEKIVTSFYNNIGKPGSINYGVGVIPKENLPTNVYPIYGTYEPTHENYGNYVHSTTGSICCYIPPFWVKYDESLDPCMDIKAYNEYNSEASANSDGYYLPTFFKNNGQIGGWLVDKYLNSKVSLGTGYVAASIKNGLPISTHADHNPIADLTACSGNYYYEVINAAHARDGENGDINPSSIWCCMPFTAQGALSFLELAIPKSSVHCAWRSTGTTHFTKGCNNNALGDNDDSTIDFISDGYSNCSKAGSANQFAKTTHNGRPHGITDIAGPMFNLGIGLTCDAVYKDITNVVFGNPTTITCVDHGLTAGDVIHISSMTGADTINNRMWEVLAVIDPDMFTIDVDSTAFTPVYSYGGLVRKGNWRIWNGDNDIATLTSGTSLNTDMFYSGSTLFDSIDLAWVTEYPNNGLGQRFGNAANSVYDLTNSRGVAGLPEASGLSTSGTNRMGKDYYYQYITNQCFPLLLGHWYAGSAAGCRYVAWNSSRSYSGNYVGFRSACFVAI